MRLADAQAAYDRRDQQELRRELEAELNNRVHRKREHVEVGPNTYIALTNANGIRYSLMASTAGGLILTNLTTNEVTNGDAVYDVRGYGTVGDGTTDDTAAFAAALLVGGNIFVPDGTYVVTQITLSVAGTRLFGGRNAIIKFKNSTANTETIRMTAARCTVEGLTVNGNKAGVTYSYNYGTIRISAADCSVKNVRLYDAQSMGIIMGEGAVRPVLKYNEITDAGDLPIFANDSGASVKPAKGLCLGNKIIGWGSSGTTAAGIGIRGTDWRVCGNLVEQTGAQSGSQLCIEVFTGGDRTVVNDNICLPLTYAEYGISMAAPDAVCTGNIVRGSTTYGIEVASSGAVVVQANTVVDATGAGISVNVNTGQANDNTLVDGNWVSNCTGVSAGQASIAITGSAVNAIGVTVSNNNIDGSAKGIYTQNNGDTLIANNNITVGAVAQSGIVHNGNEALIVGNKLMLTTGATHPAGIDVSGDDVTVCNNYIDGDAATTNGIVINSTYVRNHVFGNTVRGTTSNSIISNSTAASIHVFNNMVSGAVSLQPLNIGHGNIIPGTTTAYPFNWPVEIEDTDTLTGNVTDSYTGALILDPGYSGAHTVTRHNYVDAQNPSLSSTTLTDACLVRFDAAAGTHKAVDGSSTKSTPGGVDAWVKININGTIYYMPAYTSKTA